jgi:hypothetical protein
MTVERRRHARHKVQNKALAALASSPSVAGHIINISEGGLSFRYVSSQKRSEESPRLNLLEAGERMSLKTLPFKCVWDLPTSDVFASNTITIRHCGVKFGDLTDDEKSELTEFIQNLNKPNTKANK